MAAYQKLYQTGELMERIQLAREILGSGQHQLVILDEICVAVELGLLEVEEVVELVRSRPVGVELVLTGRRAHEGLADLADYVTEMRCVKHPYVKGTGAREGIEW